MTRHPDARFLILLYVITNTNETIRGSREGLLLGQVLKSSLPRLDHLS